MSFMSGLRDKLGQAADRLKPSSSSTPLRDDLHSRLCSTAFAACHDTVIRSFAVTPPAPSSSLLGSERAVYAVHVSPYFPQWFLSGGYDCHVRVWDLRTMTQLCVLVGHKDSVFCVQMLPDGRAASGSADKTIRVWNLKNRTCEYTLASHFGGVLGLIFIPLNVNANGKSSTAASAAHPGYLASCGADRTVRVWSLVTHKNCCTLSTGHTMAVASVVATDDETLYSASHDGHIVRWKLKLNSALSHLQNKGLESDSLTDKGELDFKFHAHDKPIHGMCLLPEGRLASGGRDNIIKIWALNSLERTTPLLILNGHTNVVNSLAWTPDRRLISGSNDHTVRVWNLDRDPSNGSYCEHAFLCTGASGADSVVYAVAALRIDETIGTGIRRSTSRNSFMSVNMSPAPSSAAASTVSSPNHPAVSFAAVPSLLIASSDATLTENQTSGARLKPERSRAKINAAAAIQDQRRREKAKRALEAEVLRMTEQQRLLEEASVDDEEFQRFTAIDALPLDAEVTPQSLNAIKKYRNSHHLNYHDILTNGWYDDGGLIPGVNAAKVGKERGGVGRWEYDVIVFDASKDAQLAAVIETAKRLVRQQETVKGRVQILAQLVSNKLGGLPSDIISAWEKVMQKASRYKSRRAAQHNADVPVETDNRTIMHIGALVGEIGLTRHRACLFKYLCDLTVQYPEEWCYPADNEAPLSPQGEGSPMPRFEDTLLFASTPIAEEAKSLNQFIIAPKVEEDRSNDAESVASVAASNVLDEDRLRMRLRTRRNSDSESSDKGTAGSIAGRGVYSPDELAIHCRLIRGQFQYYVPSRKSRDSSHPLPSSVSSSASSSPSTASVCSSTASFASASAILSPVNSADDQRSRERIGGYHAWNVVIIDGEHYIVDLICEPAMLYHEASRDAMSYNRGRHGTPKQTALTNLPIQDVREIDYSELTNITVLKDGGFGRVEKARWGNIDVVIKTPLTADTYVIKTFIEEARVLNTLNHPNVVQLLGVCSSKKAIVLEYINGGDVHQWIRQHRPTASNLANKVPAITLKQRLDVLIQCGLALQYLHGCEPPIVHRDLKTLNLLINNVGPHRVIKVCDFGLARSQKIDDGISTQHKDMGTPCFQSPEQWRDDVEERLTEKTDCYSFGGILLEVLTDRIPWYEEKSKYAIYQHVVVEKRAPPIPANASPSIPPMLVDLIRWCQAFEPERRPSFPEILRVLREVDDSTPLD